MSTEHGGCACGHDQPTDDTNLPMAVSTVATDTPSERDGCCGGDGGGGGHGSGSGCCGGHAA